MLVICCVNFLKAALNNISKTNNEHDALLIVLEKTTPNKFLS